MHNSLHMEKVGIELKPWRCMANVLTTKPPSSATSHTILIVLGKIKSDPGNLKVRTLDFLKLFPNSSVAGIIILSPASGNIIATLQQCLGSHSVISGYTSTYHALELFPSLDEMKRFCWWKQISSVSLPFLRYHTVRNPSDGPGMCDYTNYSRMSY